MKLDASRLQVIILPLILSRLPVLRVEQIFKNFVLKSPFLRCQLEELGRSLNLVLVKSERMLLPERVSQLIPSYKPARLRVLNCMKKAPVQLAIGMDELQLSRRRHAERIFDCGRGSRSKSPTVLLLTDERGKILSTC